MVDVVIRRVKFIKKALVPLLELDELVVTSEGQVQDLVEMMLRGRLERQTAKLVVSNAKLSEAVHFIDEPLTLQVYTAFQSLG